MKPTSDLEVTDEQRAHLDRLLSGGRMNSYTAAVAEAQETGQTVDPLDVYVFNMAMAAAFLGPLHLLEIATRNAMHHQLVTLARQDAWWASPEITLADYQRREVEKVERRLQRRERDTDRTWSPDDVVAGLDFGFWTGLLGRGPGTYERELWQPALRHAFPGFRGQRGRLERLMNSTRELRNRVSHHEPIHARPHGEEFADILRLIGFVSAPLEQWVVDRSTIPHVLAHSPLTAEPTRYF
jgi:hypothetical protein